MTNPRIVSDYETGKHYDVTDPAHPVEVTATRTVVAGKPEYTYKPVPGQTAPEYIKQVEDVVERWRPSIVGEEFTGTPSEYERYRAEMAAVQLRPVPVYDYRGQKIELKPSEVEQLNLLKGPAKIKWMARLGIIESEAIPVQVEKGVGLEPGVWGYRLPGVVEPEAADAKDGLPEKPPAYIVPVKREPSIMEKLSAFNRPPRERVQNILQVPAVLNLAIQEQYLTLNKAIDEYKVGTEKDQIIVSQEGTPIVQFEQDKFTALLELRDEYMKDPAKIRKEPVPDYVLEALSPREERLKIPGERKEEIVNLILPMIPGYDTAINWDKMDNAEKGWAVFEDTLIVAAIVGGMVSAVKGGRVGITDVKVGDKPIWRGLHVAGRPIVGVAGKRPTIGVKGVKLPPKGEIPAGYEPVTMVETKIMATREALKKIGYGEAEIKKIEDTLVRRGEFAGRESPYLTKEIVPEPIKSMGKEGVATVFRLSIGEGPKVKLVYGSTTIKLQLAPELKGWRKPADIDIQTTMSAAQTGKFAQKVMKALQRTEGRQNVRISEQTPTLIETRKAGKWRHAVDIHAYEDISYETAPEGAYGMMHHEPAIKIKYPGGGELRIMRLSESGKRKAASILQWQKGEIGPAAHRVKDIVDFYVILRTFKGEAIANKWAEVYGLDPKLLLKAAKTQPVRLIGWEFKPSPTVKTPTGSPSLAIAIPPSVAAISKYVKVPSSLSASISAPISPGYASIPPIGSASLSAISKSVQVSPSLAPSKKPSAYLTSVSPSIKLLSVKPSPPPPSPSPYPYPSAPPSPPPPSPPPPSAPPPSPPPPSPPPPSAPPPSPPPPVIASIRAIVKDEEKMVDVRRGAITWRQGKFWVVINPPYRQQNVYWTKTPPLGATVAKSAGSAYRTIQTLGGDADVILRIDMGAQDVVVTRPTRKAGKKGAIKFKRDPKQRTTGDISLTGVRVK